MKYQSVHVPGDLIELMSKNDSSNNNIRVDYFDIEQLIVWEDYSSNNEHESQTLDHFDINWSIVWMDYPSNN